jgi:hypothetical protein
MLALILGKNWRKISLNRIFGSKREDVTGSLIKLHNEELHISYLSPNIVRVMKSNRARWARHVACMGEMRTG